MEADTASDSHARVASLQLQHNCMHWPVGMSLLAASACQAPPRVITRRGLCKPAKQPLVDAAPCLSQKLLHLQASLKFHSSACRMLAAQDEAHSNLVHNWASAGRMYCL